MAQRLLVSNLPRQLFTARLGERVWRMHLVWHPLAQGWYLSIADSSGTSILSGIRLTSNRRLLQGYRIDFPGDLFVSGQGEPGRNAWSTTHRLIWIEADE